MLKQEELDSIKSYRYLCELVHTEINGVEVEVDDFGCKRDMNPKKAEPYGCGNMKFTPHKEVKEEVLKKYNITEEEYRMIQERLKKILSFGYCGMCI